MAGDLMPLRLLDAERRSAAIRLATAADEAEIPAAKTDAASLLDTMQAVIDAQDAVIAAMQPILDASTQAIADMQAIIDAGPLASLVQAQAAIKDLARAHKDRIRDTKACAQQIKGHVSEVRDMARCIKRTIRLVT